MRSYSVAVLTCLAATSLRAQHVDTTVGFSGIQLDSGAVVRFHWNNESEKARLLAPLGSASSEARYCGYPASSCGSELNPARARSLADLDGLDIRHGSQVGRGALLGAAGGLAGGLLIILGYGLSDRAAPTAGEQVLIVGSVTLVWTGIGALIGASLDNWKDVPP